MPSCAKTNSCDTTSQAHMKFCGRSKGREQAADGDGSPRRFGSQETTTRRRQSGVGGACESTRASGANSEPDLQRRPRPRTASSRTAGKCSKDAPLESAALASSRDDTDDAGSPRGLGGNEDGSSRQVGADGRVACSNCLRRFSPDRVGVHQDICKRVNAAAAKRERRKTPKTSKPQSASRRRRSNRPVLGQFRAAAAARERGALWSSGDQGQRHFLNPHVKFSTKNRMVSLDDKEIWRFKAPPCGVRKTCSVRPGGYTRCQNPAFSSSFFTSTKVLSLRCFHRISTAYLKHESLSDKYSLSAVEHGKHRSIAVYASWPCALK